MTERGGHVAPVAKAIIDGNAQVMDAEMPDFELDEISDPQPPTPIKGDQRKGG